MCVIGDFLLISFKSSLGWCWFHHMEGSVSLDNCYVTLSHMYVFVRSTCCILGPNGIKWNRITFLSDPQRWDQLHPNPWYLTVCMCVTHQMTRCHLMSVIWWVSPSLLDPLIQDRRVPIFRIESCLFSSDVLEAHYRKKPKTDLVPLKLAKTWHFSRSKTLSPCLGSIKTTSHSCIKCSQRTFRFY